MTAPAPAPSWGSRLAGIEGLRGLACVAVVIAHAGREMTPLLTDVDPFGKITFLRHGLTLFFVLSGFLLYRPFCAALVRGRRRPDLGRYARNRLLRIVPAYLVVLVLASVVLRTAATPTDVVETGVAAAGSLSPGLLALNATMLQNLVPAYQRTGMGVAWSLTTELTFYLVLPLLVLAGAALVARLGRSRAALVPPLLLLVVGLATKTVLAWVTRAMDQFEQFDALWGYSWLGVVARSLPAHADLFALGMLAAWVVVRAGDDDRLTARLVRARVPGLVVLLALVALSWIDGLGLAVDTVVGVACVLLVLLVVLPARDGAASPWAAVLERQPARGLGLISYSVYLWHVPLMWWLMQRGVAVPETPLGLLAASALVLAVTVAVAVPTYVLVERPALRRKTRTDVPTPTPATAPVLTQGALR